MRCAHVSSPAAALASLVMVGLAGGCPVDSRPDGAAGRLGVAMFQAETDLAFSAMLVVGSQTQMSVVAADDEVPLPTGATLRSADDDILTVGEADRDGNTPVTLVAAGEVELELVDQGGELIDAIALRAAVPGATALVDGDLLGASQVLDARLPLTDWGFLVDRDLTLLVSAVDRCGGDMLDLHASTVRTEEGTAATTTVTAGAPATFVANATAAADLTLLLETPGLTALSYQVAALEPATVDEVRVSAAAADESGGMSLWGRAYANDVEVVGPLRFSWRADPRVALSSVEGLAVEVQVSFPAEGEAPDDRPATVTAEVLGEEGTLDLFTATQETSRGEPARQLELEAASSSGCGAEACDPFAAAGLLGAALLRRRLPRSARRARPKRSAADG